MAFGWHLAFGFGIGFGFGFGISQSHGIRCKPQQRPREIRSLHSQFLFDDPDRRKFIATPPCTGLANGLDPDTQDNQPSPLEPLPKKLESNDKNKKQKEKKRRNNEAGALPTLITAQYAPRGRRFAVVFAPLAFEFECQCQWECWVEDGR